MAIFARCRTIARGLPQEVLTMATRLYHLGRTMDGRQRLRWPANHGGLELATCGLSASCSIGSNEMPHIPEHGCAENGRDQQGLL